MIGRARRVRPPIGVYWWRHRDPAIRNTGDELGPLLVRLVTGRRVAYAPPASCDLATAGSILEQLLDADRKSPVSVWGSGFLSDGPPAAGGRLHAAAVRGPLSAARVAVAGSGAPALGDPGLLADRLLRRRPRVSDRLGIVPHYVDRDLPQVRAWQGQPSVRIISPLLPPPAFVEEVARCDVILSSSLHGLVVADALGVPNRWVRLSDGVLGGGYKFRDHLRCVGEPMLEPGELPFPDRTLGARLDEVGATYRRLGLDRIRDDLERAFPAL